MNYIAAKMENESELVTRSEAACSTSSSQLSTARRNAEVAKLKAAQARKAAAVKVEIAKQQAEAKMQIAKQQAEAEAQATEDEAELLQLEARLLEEEACGSQRLSVRGDCTVIPHASAPVPPAAQPVPALLRTPALSPSAASARVRSWIDELPIGSADGSQGQGAAGAGQCHHHIGSALPRLNLEKFGGSPMEWPRWIALFKTLIHDRPELSDAEKLTHLQTYLVGDAKEAVQGLLCDGTLYLEALRELERQFGDPATIVRVNLDRVLCLPAVRENDIRSLGELSTALHTAVSVLKCLHYDADLAATNNVRNVVAKLPPLVAWKWGELKVDSDSPLTLVDLDSFLRRHVAAGRQVYDSTPRSHDRGPNKPRRAVNATSVTGRERSESCYCCDGSHNLDDCAKFKGMGAGARAELAKANNLCFKCLQSNKHIAAKCPVKQNCTWDGCGKRHHRLLHGAGKVFPRHKLPISAGAPESSAGNQVNVARASIHESEGTVLLQVLPVTIHGPSGSKTVNALMDMGSEVSLIDTELANGLGLEMGPAEPLLLSTVNEMKTHQSHKVSFDMEGNAPHDREMFTVCDVRTVSRLGIHTHVIDWPAEKNSWPHLADLPLPATTSSDVKVLLGADCFQLIVPREVRDGPPGSPSAVRCQLGWTVSNRLPNKQRRSAATTQVNHVRTIDTGLDQQIEQFWTTESFGTKYEEKPSRSRNDQRALDVLNASTVHRDGRYHTDLLWKRPDVMLPDNRAAALTRVRHTERKLDKNPDMARMYSETIEGYIHDGLAVKVSDDEDDGEDGTRWYLPHHGVTSPKKPNKVRVVFDAAARFGGTSLNDNLLTGPDLVNSLVGVLMRFRQGPIPLSADIQAMYHAVGVTESHQPALRFLWRGSDRGKEPETYQMTVHVFGAASSSCAVNYALRKCADDSEIDYPAAAAAVYKNFYVDDLLTSLETREEADQLKESLTEMLERGGFKLTKWIVPHQQRSCMTEARDLDLDDLPVERALGVHWNIVEDSFVFKVTRMNNPCTKRGILSQVSSVFDPLGMLTPFVMRAKCLLQRVWSGGYGWDEEIDDARLITEWMNWLDEIADLQQFNMQRFYRRDSAQPVTCQLHVFADASCTGFGAVAYFRLVGEDGSIWCSFVAAKGRVAPLKQLTIPRLELQAAVMATRLALLIRKEHSIEIDSTHYWSDSRTVLQWLRSESGRFHTFVANRIAEIQDSSEIGNWRHVPGTLNIADICSRGCKASELTPHSAWARGPAFIWQSEDAWPHESGMMDDVPCVIERKQEVRATLASEDKGGALMDPGRYSSLTRLHRVTAWVLRFCQNCRAGSDRRSTGPLSASEIAAAELLWLKTAQSDCFADELSALKMKKNISPKSRLLPLCPYIDGEGLIRVGGRLRHASMPDASRHQIVLPPEHDVTRMLAVQYHSRLAHPGPEHTLCAIRERFWPLRGRATVKKWTASCPVCKRRRAQPAPPVMADLPVSRVTSHEPPFSRVAVDYFGPIQVKRLRKTEKRYGCLFTCLATRAVHIEIAHSLDADSFIMAIRRMSARRGAPKVVYSDNGTNLRAGEKELRECLREMNSDKITDSLSQKGIEWHFSPPAAPHFGGVWERMVKSVKRALAVIMRETVSDETLLTMMCEAEGIVNSRPLTHVSSRPDDLQALTPSHLLLGRGNPCLPPGAFTDSDLTTRRRWRHAQRMADHFWTRWRREYLPTLTTRPKWLRDTRNLKVGDLVLIAEDNEARGHWPLGRVTRCIPGSDGRVRSVQVKTSTGTYTRPAARLCLLEESGL